MDSNSVVSRVEESKVQVSETPSWVEKGNVLILVGRHILVLPEDR